jgi:uncharacterized protein YkwD
MTRSPKRCLLPAILVAALVSSSCGTSNPAAPSSSSQSGTRVIAVSANLAFGSVEAGKTSESTLTIGNSGTATLSVTGVTVPDGYTVNWSSGTVPPGASQQVTVRFAPAAARSYDGTLVVNGDHTSGVNTASVTGKGILPTLSTIIGIATEQTAGALSGANIEIRDGPDAKKTTTTDESGRFTLSGLQPGTVTVRAWKSGYSDTDQRVTLEAGSVVSLAFSVPKVVTVPGTPSPSTPPPSTPPPTTPPPTTPPPTTPPPSTPPAPTSSPTAYDDQILQLINDHRASIGKPALVKNQVIWQQANSHSLDMASGRVPFGHDGFEARIAAIRAALGAGGSAAENVAMGYNSAAAVVNAWLGSAGHRANIEGNSTRTGISAVQTSTGTWYYTQIFY